MLRAVRECQDSRVVKRMSMGCQEGVKSCEEGVKSCEDGVKSCEDSVKSCQEGGMRVTVSRRCQELSRVCQDSVAKEHGVEGAKRESRA